MWAQPWFRRVAFYCAATLAIFWCLRWYGNRQWQRGEARGRQIMAREIEEAKKEEWAARERDLEAAAAGLAAERQSLVSAADQIARDRANLNRSLNDALESIRAERIRHYADAAATPDDRVWHDIRVVSGQLAAHP